ncbi:hypothetical protein P7C70_g1703, partial [Phenoliferia sp. Uapishka_3]
MTANLAAEVKKVNQAGITVWLRFLFEMVWSSSKILLSWLQANLYFSQNGGWMSYGLDPTSYVQLWKEVTTSVRAQTNETFMLWSPNIFTGQVNDPSQGYVPYFPGEQYVDIAGLSFYSLGFNKSVNEAPSNSLFRDNFTPFYNLLNPANLASTKSNLLGLSASIPVVISETSAPFYYILPKSSPYYAQAGDTDISEPLNTSSYTPSLASPPYSNSDDELFIKASWYVQLTSNVTAAAFPNLIAVSIFNYLKRGGDGSAPVLADFRAVGGNATVEQWFRNDIGNQTAYDLGYTGAATKLGSGWMLSSVGLALGVLILRG